MWRGRISAIAFGTETLFQFSPACGAGVDRLRLLVGLKVSILARVWRGRADRRADPQAGKFQFSPACGAGGDHRVITDCGGVSILARVWRGRIRRVKPVTAKRFNSRPRVARAPRSGSPPGRRSFQFSPACGAGGVFPGPRSGSGVSILARVWRGRSGNLDNDAADRFQFSPACGAGERFRHIASSAVCFNSRPRVARARCAVLAGQRKSVSILARVWRGRMQHRLTSA